MSEAISYIGPGPASGSSDSAPLPTEIVEASRRRLVIAIWITVAVYSIYLILYFTVWRDFADNLARATSITMITVSAGFGYYLHRCPVISRRIFLAGAIFELMLCFAIGFTEFNTMIDLTQPANMITWACVVIVFFPMLMIARPREILVSSLLAATTYPVAYAIVFPLRGLEGPTADVLFSLFLPPYVCAAMAYIPARVLSKMSAAVGKARRLGAYELIEPLGQGGMGEVWRAKHRLLIRPAAIKVIRADVLGAKDELARKGLIDRFEREAQATASLESPHTVELYDFGVTGDGAFYYVMELLKGVDLETLVGKYGPLPAERVIHILVQACDSLQDAHDSGLVHRDIKPANIFVGKKARRHDFVSVVDFGLVKLDQSTKDSGEINLTREGDIGGTPAYMAPEMVSGDAIGPATDLYSLGCVAYFLLTGKLLFEEDNAMKMALAHVTKKPSPPSMHTELPIPEGLEATVMQCLEKPAEGRPGSALEIAERLEALAQAEPWNEKRAARWWSRHMPQHAVVEKPSQSISRESRRLTGT